MGPVIAVRGPGRVPDPQGWGVCCLGLRTEPGTRSRVGAAGLRGVMRESPSWTSAAPFRRLPDGRRGVQDMVTAPAAHSQVVQRLAFKGGEGADATASV